MIIGCILDSVQTTRFHLFDCLESFEDKYVNLPLFVFATLDTTKLSEMQVLPKEFGVLY